MRENVLMVGFIVAMLGVLGVSFHSIFEEMQQRRMASKRMADACKSNGGWMREIGQRRDTTTIYECRSLDGVRVIFLDDTP